MTSTPRGGNFGGESEKLLYFLKNLFLYSKTWFTQTKCIAVMTMEGFNQIVNLMIPRAGVLVLGQGHICHIAIMHYF